MEDEKDLSREMWAIIRTQIEGFHYWEEAPEEVSFLRNRHRHIFFVELWVEQMHNERDVEYILEKRNLDKYLSQSPIKTGGGFSCETIASDIKQWWENLYPDRKIKVGVFEDNENGVFIE